MIRVSVAHEDGTVEVALPRPKDRTVEETLALAVEMVTASYKTMIESEAT